MGTLASSAHAHQPQSHHIMHPHIMHIDIFRIIPTHTAQCIHSWHINQHQQLLGSKLPAAHRDLPFRCFMGRFSTHTHHPKICLVSRAGRLVRMCAFKMHCRPASASRYAMSQQLRPNRFGFMFLSYPIHISSPITIHPLHPQFFQWGGARDFPTASERATVEGCAGEGAPS